MNERNNYSLPEIKLLEQSEPATVKGQRYKANLREMLDFTSQINKKHKFPIAIGTALDGEPVVLDLAHAPHILITCSNANEKNAVLDSTIINLLFHFQPDELKFIMIDPADSIFEKYQNLPHLLTPVVNETQKVLTILRWVNNEVERRYRILAQEQAKTLSEFNSHSGLVYNADGKEFPTPIPYLVIFVGELADSMKKQDKEVIEKQLCTIALKGRAAGIHLVVGSAHSSPENLTGFIKANLPTRICFKPESAADSRKIHCATDAEKLSGCGDLILSSPDSGSKHVQSVFIPDSDIHKIVAFICGQAKPIYNEQVEFLIK